MGSFNIKRIENSDQKNLFYKEIFDDLEVFDRMLAEGVLDSDDNTIGVEQELCLIDKFGLPRKKALEFLNGIKELQYTNELALFNAEINLDPKPLQGLGLKEIADQLYSLIEVGRKAGKPIGTELFLTGILPTLTMADLTFESMTPIERYKVLSQELLNLRGEKFEIFLEGVDDVKLKLESILFEACNTSIQLHMQINPARFVHMYNWSQLISGPVLSVCTNSPLLFGKELWSENRIALFKQSLDTRIHYNHFREKVPRVYFGEDWLQKSPSELWKSAVARFPLVFRCESPENSKLQYAAGETPELKSVRLHNGTTYTWNRMCYGVDNNLAHLRIECRYLPSGPTLADEVANMVFWVGLMKAGETQEDNFWKKINFSAVKSNFYKAARTGLLTEFDIFGENIAASELISNTLIPLAEKGLQDSGVDPSIISRYLNIISERIEKNQTGSIWQVENFRRLSKKFKPALVSKILVTESLIYQKEDVPVSEWSDIPDYRLHMFFENNFRKLTAKDIMSHKIQAIAIETSVLFALRIMEWQNIHHLIVEDKKEVFKGVVYKPDIESVANSNESIAKYVSKNFHRVYPNTPVSKIQQIVSKEEGMAVVVIDKNKTVGIITKNDL
jgi:predicted transcriptional regulator